MAGKWRLTVVGARRHPGRVWDVGSRQGATPCPESPCQPARQKWHSLAPQSHLAWALLVMFGGVRETLLPSAPSPGTNLGADMQRGPGANTLQIQYNCIDYKIQMHDRFTTANEYATNTVQYTDTRRGARGKGADCSWGEV